MSGYSDYANAPETEEEWVRRGESYDPADDRSEEATNNRPHTSMTGPEWAAQLDSQLAGHRQLIKAADATQAQHLETCTYRTAAPPIPAPPTDSKMSIDQLRDRIAAMTATAEARDLKRGTHPPTKRDAEQYAKLSRYAQELARRQAAAPPTVTEITSEAITPEDRLAHEIRQLVKIHGRPAVIDATWKTGKQLPEAWR